MRDISGIPFGARVEVKVRGVLVNRPEVGGEGAIRVDRYGWIKRIDEVDTVTELVNGVRARTLPKIDDRVLAALPMLADGMTSDEIAEQLVMHPDTFKSLLSRGMKAWGARGRTHFVALAYRYGVLEVPRAS